MSDWWSRKLGTPPQARPRPEVQSTPAYQQPAAPEHVPTKTTFEKDAGTCPGCGGGNYFAFRQAGHEVHRCYDCGYPLEQSTSGLQGTGDGGPTKAARQIPTEGYQPQNIIGRA